MDKRALIRTAETFGCAGCDNPFAQDGEMTVFRHRGNKKWFGIYFRVPRRIFGQEVGSEYALNVKCDPALARLLFATYAGIVPAYHMSKTHWITVRLNGSVPAEEIERLLRLSYDIVAPKSRAPAAKNVKKS